MPNPAPPRLGPGRFQKVRFKGKVQEPDNVSGVARVKVPHGPDFLVLGSDETESVQILRQTDDPLEYKVLDVPVPLPMVRPIREREKKPELDIEGVAAEGATVYVTGSHAQVRKTPKPGKPIAVPSEPGPAPGDRDWVFRFDLGADGRPVAGSDGRPRIGWMSLRAVLDQDPVLKLFRAIPSKENGIDIEGLAARDGELFFGFRGPVLRGNWVPILRCGFGPAPQNPVVSYVQLGGRGIRDLVPIRDGFVILAGPVGDGDSTYQLYHWDGRDGMANDHEVAVPIAELPRFETENGTDHVVGKPESLTVLHAKPTGHGVEYDLLLVCDGLHDGGPLRFRLTV